MGNHESVELRCPTCGHTLERLGSREIGGNDADSGRVHSYGCPSGGGKRRQERNLRRTI